MTTTATHEHVTAFLLPLDASGRFMRAARAFSDCARRDRDSSNVLAAIQEWVDAAEIDPEHRAAYHRLRRRRTSAVTGASPEVSTLLAVTFLWTTETLRTASGRLDSPEVASRAFRRIPRRLERLERDFLGELLVETELRAARDQAFAAKLDDAIGELRSVVPELGEIARRLPFPDASADSAPMAVVKKRPDLEENFAFYVLVGVAILVVAVAGKAIEAEGGDDE